MSESQEYDVMIVIPETEARALAKLVGRIDFDTCHRFASITANYDGRCEADVMWCALCHLQRQLADAGFAPR
jgi:hypothetical protein